MADALVLASQRVLPEHLARLQYQFKYPELSSALSDLV
jgi:NAD dependent epimerase/dehydratase family enzyme